MVFIIKRIIFYVFLAASLCVAVWGYFRLKQSKEPKAVVTEHIPANVQCVIETKSTADLITKLTRQNLIWNSLLTEESCLKAQTGIRYLDSLINTHEDVAGIIENNSVYWSFIHEGKRIEHLVQFKLKEQNETTVFETFFTTVFKKNPSVSSFDAYDVKLGKEDWLISLKDGIVYFSSDLGVLQNAIQLDKKESLASNVAYTDLLKTNGEQTTQIYFNHAVSNMFDRTLFTKQSIFSTDVQLNEITFNGYTVVDSLSFLNSLKNQQAESIHQFENLPNNPISIIGVNAGDAKLFYSELLKRNTDEVIDACESAWKSLNDSALYNIKQECFENISGEIVTANYWINNSGSQITSVKIKDEEKAESLMKLMSDSITIHGDLHVYKINQQFGGLFSFFNIMSINKYVCLHQDALFFFSDKEIFDYYNECLTTSNLLVKNLDFMGYANDNLVQESNFLYYENCTEIRQTNFPRFINCNELNTGDEVLSKLSFSAKNHKSSMQVRINATHAKEKNMLETNANALWTFVADSVINTNAYLFTNHLTQENEVCFQDEAKDLYLINSTGNIIWKRNIPENIRSGIYTVDIFKNGKLQLLFNTDNYLHLIDRNGAYVQGFPVKLPAKVTSNITLLDYDNNKDYRLFVACADKKIYNYTLYGIKTEGFVPVRTDGEVTLPISYVHVGPSDYLVTADVHGKIYAFSRKGEGRIDFKNKTIEYLTHLYVMTGNNLDNSKIIYVDDKNNLLSKISLTDKKEALKLGDELSGFKATFDLIDDDAQSDVILYGNGAVYGYDLFSSRLIESFNEQAVYESAQIANTSNNQWLLGYDKAAQKIDIIGKDGKAISSIANATQKPLVCNLYKDGKTYILVVGKNKISCQELN